MLNTIEQKLSAIKAINEQKEVADRSIAALQDYDLNPGITPTMSWKDRTVTIPDAAKAEIFHILKRSFEVQKAELIEKATELMK
jgi:hypothetical protein